MANVGRIEVEITANNKGLRKGVKDSKKQLGGLGKAAQNAGGMLAGAFAGVVIINGIKNAIKSIAQLESSIKRVSLIAGGGEEAFAKLAKTLGSTTVFTANEAAGAMQFLAQAGFNTNQIMAATPGVLDLAAAAQLDLGRAADITSNILSGFGMAASEVNRVNDILVTTTNSANLSVEQMGEAMKVVAPIAKSAGISINEVAGFMGVLGDAGIQGSLAGTQLKGAISSLLKPSKDASATMERLGVEIVKNDNGSINLSKTFKALGDAGMTTADAFTIFGERSAAGALVMGNATIKADALAVATTEVGVASEQASAQLDTLAGDLALLSSAWDGQIQKGSKFNFILRGIVQGLTDLASANFTNTSIMHAQEQAFIDQFSAMIKADDAARDAKDAVDELTDSVEDNTLKTVLNAEAQKAALTALEARKALSIALYGRSISLTEAVRDGTEAIKMQNVAHWGTYEVKKLLSDQQKGELKSLTAGIEIKGVDIKATDKQTTSQQKAAAAAGEAAVQSAVLAAANRDGAKAIVQASLAAALASIIKSSALSASNPILALALAGAGVAGINALFAAIPEFAAGGIHDGGLAQVNERGGEIMDLPNGTRIIPHGLAKGMSGGTSITVNGFVGNEQELALQITQVLENQAGRTNRLM